MLSVKILKIQNEKLPTSLFPHNIVEEVENSTHSKHALNIVLDLDTSNPTTLARTLKV